MYLNKEKLFSEFEEKRKAKAGKKNVLKKNM